MVSPWVWWNARILEVYGWSRHRRSKLWSPSSSRLSSVSFQSWWLSALLSLPERAPSAAAPPIYPEGNITHTHVFKKTIFFFFVYKSTNNWGSTHSLLFPLLFDHVGEDFSSGLSLSVQQVRWHCSLWRLVVILLFRLPLFVHLDAADVKVRLRIVFQDSWGRKQTLLNTHVFFIWIFSACLCLWYSLAFRPISFLALWERSWASRLSFFLFLSWWSRRYPCRLRCNSMCSFWGCERK